jgi:hypothetical protein
MPSPQTSAPVPPSSPRPLICVGGRTTPAPHRILSKSFPPPPPCMTHRRHNGPPCPSSVESPSGTPSTSRNCRSRPGRQRPPRGAPQRPNTVVPPSFAGPKSTAPHSEPRYPPPCLVGRPCHRGARREDPSPVRSSMRRCASYRHGRVGRVGRINLSAGLAVSGLWAEADPALCTPFFQFCLHFWKFT